MDPIWKHIFDPLKRENWKTFEDRLKIITDKN